MSGSIACRLQQLAEEIHSPDLTSERAKEIKEELKVLAATAHILKQYIQMPVVNSKNKNEPIPHATANKILVCLVSYSWAYHYYFNSLYDLPVR